MCLSSNCFNATNLIITTLVISPLNEDCDNIWINMAKRPETIRRRLAEALEKLERGEELGLK